MNIKLILSILLATLLSACATVVYPPKANEGGQVQFRAFERMGTEASANALKPYRDAVEAKYGAAMVDKLNLKGSAIFSVTIGLGGLLDLADAATFDSRFVRPAYIALGCTGACQPATIEQLASNDVIFWNSGDVLSFSRASAEGAWQLNHVEPEKIRLRRSEFEKKLQQQIAEIQTSEKM